MSIMGVICISTVPEWRLRFRLILFFIQEATLLGVGPDPLAFLSFTVDAEDEIDRPRLGGHFHELANFFGRGFPIRSQIDL